MTTTEEMLVEAGRVSEDMCKLLYQKKERKKEDSMHTTTHTAAVMMMMNQNVYSLFMAYYAQTYALSVLV